MKEADELTRHTVTYLNLLGHFAWRQNNGMLKGKYRIGIKGLPDIFCLTKTGKLVAIEVKIGKDKQSEDQKIFQDQIERHDGHYIIIKKFEDVENFFTKPLMKDN